MAFHESENNGMTKQWFFYVLLTIASASLGYGVSQETMRVDVQSNTDRIQYIANLLQTETNERQTEYSGLQNQMRVLIDQNSQLISLIRAQNQILNGK